VRDGDVVLWFNFRADRAASFRWPFSRRISTASTARWFLSLHYVTLTEYDETYGIPVVFAPQSLKNILGEVIMPPLQALRIAETEKYPHVTFFSTAARRNRFGRRPDYCPVAEGCSHLRSQAADERAGSNCQGRRGAAEL